jgi:hypothetical protein
MGRLPEFVDLDYDRRLAEFKALKAKLKQEQANQKEPVTRKDFNKSY